MKSGVVFGESANFLLGIWIGLSLMGCATSVDELPTFEDNWQSLSEVNETPDWFLNAKFGIYTHWGPISEAMHAADTNRHYRGWHGMCMYQDGQLVPTPSGNPSNNYLHHVEKYGDPAQFGYRHVIEQFNPTAFDATEWADVFVRAGAKFAGPVAMHHDNFAMWDSKVTRWNSMAFGGIDPSADLKYALEERGLRFMGSFHHAFTWKYFAPAHQHGGIAPEDYDLYTNPHGLDDDAPDAAFYRDWWAKVTEFIEAYQPDMIWFDWWLENLSEEMRQEFLAYYYNKAEEWGKDVAVCFKETTFPLGTAIRDYERGRPNQPRDPAWLTDTSPGAWFYRPNAKFKSANELIDILIDIVSKNGIMLLNVPPDPDGRIPPAMVDLLSEMGTWLDIYGPAIYDTRPWTVFGEGPTRLPEGGHKNEKLKLRYTAEDIRYTRKGEEELYALVMDRPTHDITLKVLSTHLGALNAPIKSIELLGSKEEIIWSRSDQGLVIQLPKMLPSTYAIAFKIVLEQYEENKIG
ncbi:MAG: alpha-L-fucosidase [Saprospiraceae bacterium]|nr:alpha-L-fucosidase [Saprospiraceae bacterium]